MLGASCLLLALCSFNGNDIVKIVARKWQIESVRTDAIDKKLAEAKEQFDTTKDQDSKGKLVMSVAPLQMMKNLANSMNGASMEFRIDSTYSYNGSFNGQDSKILGKWYITNDGKELILNHSNDSKKNDTADIISASENLLTLNAKLTTGMAVITGGTGISGMVITMKAIE